MSTGDTGISEMQTNGVPLELLLATYILTARDKEIDESTYNILLDSLDKILFFNKKENEITLNYSNKVIMNIDNVQLSPKPEYIFRQQYISENHDYNYECENNIYISNLFINFNIPDINIEFTINENNNRNSIKFLLNCKNKENAKCRIVGAVIYDPIQIKNIKLQINDKLILILTMLLLGGDNISISNIDNCSLEDNKAYKATLIATIVGSFWNSCLRHKEKIILEGFVSLPKCIEDIINKTVKLANNIRNKIFMLSNKNIDYILNMLPNLKKDYINELVDNARLKTFESIALRLLQQNK